MLYHVAVLNRLHQGNRQGPTGVMQLHFLPRLAGRLNADGNNGLETLLVDDTASLHMNACNAR